MKERYFIQVGLIKEVFIN